MSEHRTPLDTTLARTLGTASLSPEQRRRHLDRIAEHGSSRGLSPGRLLRDGSMAVVLIAMIAAVWMMLPLGESSDSDVNPMAAIAEFRESIKQADLGEARHMTIELTSTDILDGSDTDHAGEIWEHTTVDGDVNRAILNFSSEGEIISRYVRLGDRWVYQGEEFHRDGQQRNSSLFAALPTYALEMTSAESLKGEIDDILNDDEVVLEEENGRLIITRDGSYDTTSAGDEANVADFNYLEELTIDIEEDRLVRWRLIADDDGEQHGLYSLTYGEWQEIDPSDIPEHVFAEQTDMSEPELDIPLPMEIELSIGTIRMQDAGMRSSSSGFIRYRGPEPLFFELSIMPADDEHAITDQSEPEHPIEINGIDGHWIKDPEQDWPRVAIWSDSELTYSLYARNLPEGGWTEDDLYELIEAIIDHQPSP